MQDFVDEAVRQAYSERFGRSVADGAVRSHVAEIKRLLVRLNIGVLDVPATPRRRGANLRVVFNDDWQPLDDGWTREDSMAAMFNALESGGFRHVPGTSGFDGESTVFVKDGLEFDFARPPFPD